MLQPRQGKLLCRRVDLETDLLSVFEKKAQLKHASVMRVIEACFEFSKHACFCSKDRVDLEVCMKTLSLRTLIFLALCCDLGLFSKRLISPVANLLTDFLHIPGGIGTSFSLMFLVVAAVMADRFGCAAVMGIAQSALALAFGMVGSMGALSAIGYVVPGIVIDLLLFVTRKSPLPCRERVVLSNAIAAPCAALTANIIVFRLRGAALLLYLCVSVTSGAIFGLLGAEIVRRLTPIFGGKFNKTQERERI